MSDKKSSNAGCNGFGIIGAVAPAIIGWSMHGSVFYTIMDILFWPLVWCKWLIMQQVTMTIIKNAFSFFFK